MKQIFLIISIIFINVTVACAQGSQENIYYLADTANVGASTRILSIEREGKFNGYVFYCRCISKNEHVYPAFIYDVNQSQNKTFSKLPDERYLSWKELEDLLYQKQQNFDNFYSLEIVEKLPDGTFKKNKVKLVIIKTVTTE